MIAAAQRIARGSVEAREESIACGVDLAAAESREPSTNPAVMFSDQGRPGAVAKFGGLCRRPDDVREKDCGQDSLRFRLAPVAAVPNVLEEGVNFGNDCTPSRRGKRNVLRREGG